MKPFLKSDLIRIIIAAELSTRPQFRGMGAGNPQLQEIANEWMHRREGHMMRATVEDGAAIADEVWRQLRPHLIEMIRPLCDSTIKDTHLSAMVDRVFVDNVTRVTWRSPG